MARALIFGLILVGASFPAWGQQTQGADPLMDICSGFLEQSGQGVSGDSQRLCACLTRETQTRLSRQEMQVYSDATRQGRSPPDSVMQKVLGIARQCLNEARQ